MIFFGEKKQREREKIKKGRRREEEHRGLGVLYRAEIRTEGP